MVGALTHMSCREATALLAQRTRLRDVAPADLRVIAERGFLRAKGDPRHPRFEVAELDGFTAVEELRQVGEERRAWRAASLDRSDAADALGLTLMEFDGFATRHGLQAGAFGRFERCRVSQLGALMGVEVAGE
jgi:hypothetical protein